MRPVEGDDVSRLVEVWLVTWPSTYTAPLGATAVEAMLRDPDENGAAALMPEGARALCLLKETQIVGTAIHSSDGPHVYLWGMYVMPAHQRSGAGTLLLQAVRGAAYDRPIEVRVLQSSLHARHFYEKHGFQTFGEERGDIMPGVEAVCLMMRQTS